MSCFDGVTTMPIGLWAYGRLPASVAFATEGIAAEVGIASVRFLINQGGFFLISVVRLTIRGANPVPAQPTEPQRSNSYESIPNMPPSLLESGWYLRQPANGWASGTAVPLSAYGGRSLVDATPRRWGLLAA